MEKSNFNASAEERDLGMEDGFDLPEVGHVKATLNKKVDKMKNKVEGVTRGYGTRQRKNKDIARRDNENGEATAEPWVRLTWVLLWVVVVVVRRRTKLS